MKTYRQTLCIGIALFLLGALFSCTNNEGDSTRLTNTDGSEVVLSLRLPGAMEAMTRLEPAEEDKMKEVDVLVFEHTDGDTGKYLYTTTGYNVTEESLTARLHPTETGETVDLWVIANARSVLNNTDMVGKTKEEIQLLLLANNAATPIPMWGTTENVTVSKNAPTPGTVNMIRMAAKIHVQISDEIKTQENFQLTSVHFYNGNTTGYIVPCKDNIDWVNNPPTATAPSLPINPVKATAAFCGVSNSYRENNNDIIANFYTLETVAGEGYTKSADYESEPCLIIGGKYKTSEDERPLDNIPETYYRVDFYAQGNAGEAGGYLALLRNHQYKVILKDIGGPGYPLIGDALNAPPINAVLEWSNDDYLDVTSDGKNYLAVSRKTIEIPDRMEIDVLTNCENGWVIGEKSGDFYLSQEAGDPGLKVQLTATALYENTTREVGWFYIVAGPFKQKIVVNQTEQDIYFRYENVENESEVQRGELILEFYGSTPYKGRVEITAYCEPNITVGSGERYFDGYESSLHFPVTVLINEKNETIKHRVINYMYSITGVERIPLSLTHRQVPDYGIYVARFSMPISDTYAYIRDMAPPPPAPWSYMKTITSLSWLAAEVADGGLDIYGDPCVKGSVENNLSTDNRFFVGGHWSFYTRYNDVMITWSSLFIGGAYKNMQNVDITLENQEGPANAHINMIVERN